jgi:transposase
MEHLFLYRMQEHELTMRQMVEEIKAGTLNILQAATKYQVNRSTVKRWLAKIENEEQQRVPTGPEEAPKTIVEQIATRADKLEGKVKELEKALKEAQMKALYYSTLVKVAEQELGIDIEKKSATKQSDSSK